MFNQTQEGNNWFVMRLDVLGHMHATLTMAMSGCFTERRG